MAIVLKDFEWRENPEWIFIVVNVKGVRTGNIDIVSSPNYLKLHYTPFIFEVFLSGELDDTQSECLIDEKSEKVSFRLKKATPCALWKQLENKELTKEEKRERRLEAFQITQDRNEKEKSEKQKRQFDRKQVTVRDQMKLDAVAKDRIEKERAFESEKALASFGLEETIPALKEKEESKDPVEKRDKSNSKIDLPKNIVKINNSNANSSSSTQIFELPKVDVESRVGIRPSICISVNFTPREFPTPSRESKHVEEQEWLKKQAEARRLCGFVNEDLRPEERNPQWLLDKGLSLMKAASYLGAISAFSLGIRLAPKMAELYVERAGAHLAMKNYHRAVDDSSQALELLTPKVDANEKDRLKCYIRRGNAFRELDMWEEALTDYNQAISLNPNNLEELSSVRNEIELALQTSKASLK